MDLHQYVYSEETALFGSEYTDMYDNSIRYSDLAIGQLLVTLSELGQLDDTLIVVTSDHGEAFRERGLEGHARAVYRETTEVPLLIGFPFRLDPGLVVETSTRSVDVWPTLLDLIGAPPLEDTDGESLRPAILRAARGEASDTSETTNIAHLDQHWGQTTLDPLPTVAVTQGRHRFIYTEKRAGGVREELFDRLDDPDELRDVIDEQSQQAEHLRALALDYLERSPAPPWGVDAPEVDIDQLNIQQLRALGYSIP